MKRSAWLGLVVVAGLLVGRASGQVPPPAQPLGRELAAERTADAPNGGKIHTFVSDQFQALQSLDTHNLARAKLIAECPRGAKDPFYAIYAKEVNDAATAVFGGAQPVNVKVAAAVVVETVARNGGVPGTAVRAAALAALGDREASVAMWGVKAARSLINAEVQSPTAMKTDLGPAIVKAVDSHGGPADNTGAVAGGIASDAFDALAARNAPQANPANRLLLIDPTIDLIEVRTKLYAQYIPASPAAEHIGIGALNNVRAQMTDPQQKRFMQAMVDLISAAGQRCNAVATDRLLFTQVRDTIRYAAGDVTNMLPKDPTGVTGLASVDSLAKMGPGMTAAQIQRAADAVARDVQNLAAWNGLKIPPPLPPMVWVPPAPAK